MRKIIFIFIIGLALSCNNASHDNRQSQNVTQVTGDITLAAQKSQIDSAIAQNNLNAECYFSDSGKYTIGNCQRQEYSAMWRIWKNSSDKIVSAKNEYSSQSMDIFVQEMFYYNSNEQLFCRDQSVSFLNTLCSEKGIIHHKTYYFKNGVVTDSSSSLYDSDNKTYSIDSCLIPYSVNVQIPFSVSSLQSTLKNN